MKIKWSVFVVFMVAITMVDAKPLDQGDKERLALQQQRQHVLYEFYLDTDRGVASVIGYHFDMYIAKYHYLSTAIFGAITGERGGYGIAAVGYGYRRPLTENIEWDSKVLVGSGGGGGLAAGGGFAVEVMTGLSLRLTDQLTFDVKGGYLRFPTGRFETPILNIGLALNRQHLYLPF